MTSLRKAAKKFDEILADELPDTDQNPMPRGGAKPDPAPQPKPKPTFHVVAGLLVALVLTAGCNPPIEGTPTPAPTTVATCDEDQPWCWDCSRDGNKICGPVEVQR